MPEQYDNSNRGALFKNSKKETANQPDYTGTINAIGVEYWLSAWIKKSKSGQTYMSLSIKLKDAPETKASQENSVPHLEQDIPF